MYASKGVTSFVQLSLITYAMHTTFHTKCTYCCTAYVHFPQHLRCLSNRPLDWKLIFLALTRAPFGYLNIFGRALSI